jgi:putative endonuclease
MDEPEPDPGAQRPGRSGEDLAAAYLREKGIAILERNYRCRAGEIDIVARDGGVVVFVEVKERRSESHGTAVEAVTWRKRQRIVRAARVYAAVHQLADAPVRFDVLAIDWGPSGPRVRHDAGAFGED